jgi:hypothetical protein
LQVVTPYRPGMLFARTYDIAKAWEGGCRFVPIRNADEQADPSQYNPTYPELLADLWDQGEGVIMLEHDVVPFGNSIAEIAGCPHPWCGYRYPNGGDFNRAHANLGCTKITDQMMTATAEWGRSERTRRGRWDWSDARLSTWAYCNSKMLPHRHFPDVAHRATRHTGPEHWLGNEYVDIDEHGEVIGGPREPYKPIQPPKRDLPKGPSHGDEGDDRTLDLTLDWISRATSMGLVDDVDPQTIAVYAKLAGAYREVQHRAGAFEDFNAAARAVGSVSHAVTRRPVAVNPYAEMLRVKTPKLNQAIARALGTTSGE